MPHTPPSHTFALPSSRPLSLTHQVLVSLAFIAGLARARVMDFGGRPTLAHARSVFWLAFFWMAYVQSGVIALRYLTVPMYR